MTHQTRSPATPTSLQILQSALRFQPTAEARSWRQRENVLKTAQRGGRPLEAWLISFFLFFGGLGEQFFLVISAFYTLDLRSGCVMWIGVLPSDPLTMWLSYIML
jgi:hypothetical protein